MKKNIEYDIYIFFALKFLKDRESKQVKNVWVEGSILITC